MNKKIMQLHNTLAKLRAGTVQYYHEGLSMLEDLINDIQNNYALVPISTLNRITEYTTTKNPNDHDFPMVTHNLILHINTQAKLGPEATLDVKQELFDKMKNYLEQEPEDI